MVRPADGLGNIGLTIKLVAVGKRPESWIEDGYRSYARRLRQDLSLQLVEISSEPGRSRTPAEIRRVESTRILPKLDAAEYVIALDEQGERWSTLKLAEEMDKWRQSFSAVAVVIGGAEGLDRQCLERADRVLSLSALTFPHGLVRVMVAEQLYRAWTVLSGHPYHRS